MSKKTEAYFLVRFGFFISLNSYFSVGLIAEGSKQSEGKTDFGKSSMNS
jgi:hypothetical protein